MEKCFCSKLKKLEKRIKKLEKNYIPNQELKALRDRLINKVMKGNFVSYTIDEGSCGLYFPKVYEMLHDIRDKGNFYILLCGANCAHDIIRYAKDENEVNNLLDNYYIKKIFDTRVDKDKAYLIALNNIKQKKIPDENIAMFTREDKPLVIKEYVLGKGLVPIHELEKKPDIEIRKETDVKDPREEIEVKEENISIIEKGILTYGEVVLVIFLVLVILIFLVAFGF